MIYININMPFMVYVQYLLFDHIILQTPKIFLRNVDFIEFAHEL